MIGRVTRKLIGTLIEVRLDDGTTVEAVGIVAPKDWVELIETPSFKIPVAKKTKRPKPASNSGDCSSASIPPQKEPNEVSVFRKILSSPKAMSQPVPAEAVMASWMFSVLTLADATAGGPDEYPSVPVEAERRLLAAGIPPLVAEHVRRYAQNLGL